MLVLGSFQVNGVVPQANGDSSKVKVKVRVNINGLFNVSGATITEKVENTPAADDEQEPMDVDGSAEKTPDAGAGTEASDNQPQEQAAAAEEGDGDSPKESSTVNDIADVEPASKDADAATKVQRCFNLRQRVLLMIGN